MGAFPIQQGRFFFEEVGALGAGGLGRVGKIRITASRAPDLPVGSVWARKQLNSEWAANPAMIARLDREIAALKGMTHPNIISFRGENLPGGQRFYVMPLFENTVRQHIARGGWKGNWREIANAGAGLADAMQYAHERGYIHRDVKPDNILFNAGGPLVIADWGIGYFVHKESKVLMQLTRGGMGTEYYCSIEQWASGKCDGRGDIYALGMALDEWVTGQQRAIAVGMGLSTGPVTTQTPGATKFNRLLQSMTSTFVAGRPTSMRAVAAELRAAAALT